MTNAISPPPSAAYHPVPSNATQDGQRAGELLAAEPPVSPRVRQLAMFARNLLNALGQQVQAADRHVAQLKTSQQFGVRAVPPLGLETPISTLGPTGMQIDGHPELAEELNKHRLRESRLAQDLSAAARGSQRAEIELLRAFNFLQPEDVRDDRSASDERPINPADKDMTGVIWGSHADFYDRIALLIGALQEQWLSKYQDAMGKFLEFYKEFSDILEKIKVSAHGDKGDVKFDAHEAHGLLKDLIAKYGLDENALASFPSEQGAQQFIDSLGLPGLEAVKGEDGQYRVKMNLSDAQQILDSIPLHNGVPNPVTWDSAKYNAWLSAKDSSVEQIKHVSKVLGEKLSEMTQKFDSIVKTLSSTIDKITECDMGFVNGLG